MDDIVYANVLPVEIDLPFTFNLDHQKVTLNDAEIALNKIKIFLNGTVHPSASSNDIGIDMAFHTNTWEIPEVIEIIPETYKSMLNDITANGNLELKGNAKGTYNDSLMPIITANVFLADGQFAYKKFALPFKNISADVLAYLDLNTDSLSMVNIHSLKAQTGKNTLEISGSIIDLFNKMLFKVNVNSNLELVELKPVLPSDMNLIIKGKAKANMNTDFAMNDMQNLDLQKIKLNGDIRLIDMEAVYNDSIFVNSPDAILKISSAKTANNKIPDKLFDIEILSKDMDIEMIDVVNATLKEVKLKAQVSDFMDTTKPISAHCDFDFGNLNADMDTIDAAISGVSGSLTMIPSKKNKNNPEIRFTYNNKKIAARMGNTMSFTGDIVKLKGKGIYDDQEKELFLQWSPDLNANISNGILHMSSLNVPVEIPSIIFDFTPEKFVINESHVILDKSSFKLSGVITNIDKYYRKTDLLKANLDFVSDNTNINQIMDIVSGFGTSDSAAATDVDVVSKEDNPFMVPLGIDVLLNTWVKKATVGQTIIENVQGSLTVKDGVMILEEIGFTCEAAKMQLTAIYRSPRKNHLFAGIDFHLLDVDIASLLKMIPEIDTLVPMLKSFAGKAEFHLGAQTNLKSNYELKMSTLRASAALEGQDLVLMDSETFSEIAKQLVFNKKTENIVDSISVEMTVFKDEIDIYPFLIVMDKYKAVVSGRHNLDMSFDYHISVTDSPLPTRLGLDVSGNIQNLKYKLVPCKYANLYRPEKQKAVEKRTMELKKLISDALKENVKQ
ncbi:MAG: AsmA-like C-terminal region-containing protein [Bacteroidales bacterium]|nr:AsmA-like C-terminal region-containing protein [Bacteroidales bacterium]